MAKQRRFFRGMLAGAVGGLAAAWVMNEFMAGPGEKLRKSVQTEEQRREEQAHSHEPKQDATMKAAEAIVSTATSGRHLSWEEQKKAGPVVHYAFGAFSGAIYGGLAEYSYMVRSGFGSGFGSVLFGMADLLAVPAFNLSGSPGEQPPSALATPFAAHVVYGATTEAVRRIVRKML